MSARHEVIGALLTSFASVILIISLIFAMDALNTPIP